MQRKKYSAELKAKIALEAIKGLKAINEIAGEYSVHPTQITHWKKQALAISKKIWISPWLVSANSSGRSITRSA